MNLYWPVYKTLESETLSLARCIHFNEDHLQVYSMTIANIIVRCAIEIESISKELYQGLGGVMNPVDENGQPRDLYFDTDCLQLLEDRWKLSEKAIQVTTSEFYFEEDCNRVLTPLRKANKRGSSGCDWKRAYQAIKHSRVASLPKATVKHLVRALGALFILNLYYKDERFSLAEKQDGAFDPSVGSNIFSVFVARADEMSFNSMISDENILPQTQTELPRSIYIRKYDESSLRAIHKNVSEMNRTLIERAAKSLVIANFRKSNPNKNFDNVCSLAMEAGGIELLRELFRGINIGPAFSAAHYEAVLNKSQVIYPKLG